MICSSLNLLRFIPSDFTQNRSHFRRARQRTAALIWQAAAKSQSAPRIERQPSRPALPNFLRALPPGFRAKRQIDVL
jgi:hypothetical protein